MKINKYCKKMKELEKQLPSDCLLLNDFAETIKLIENDIKLGKDVK